MRNYQKVTDGKRDRRLSYTDDETFYEDGTGSAVFSDGSA
jgi:hypothetical protein